MAIKDDDLLYVQRPSGADAGSYKETVGNLKTNIEAENDLRYLRIDPAAGEQTVESPDRLTLEGGLDLRGVIVGDTEDNPPGLTVTHGFKSKSIFTGTSNIYVQNFSQPDFNDTGYISGLIAHFQCAKLRNFSASMREPGDEPSTLICYMAAEQAAGDSDGVLLPESVPVRGFFGGFTKEQADAHGSILNVYLRDAPSFSEGSFYIGGSVSRNTRELWQSTLNKTDLDKLYKRELVVPANVSNPGDGEFARQWWYDQQSAENQALIDSGELEYPEHLAVETFTDTFALGDNSNINLLSTGEAKFAGDVEIAGMLVGHGGSTISNTVVGQNSFRNNTTGSGNTCIGTGALQKNTTGRDNNALGQGALPNNTEGFSNIGIGNFSLNKNQTGSGNIAVGDQALKEINSGSNNTAIGNGAGLHFTGSNNTILGAYRGEVSDNTLNDTVIISAGQTERIRIDSNGNVGIGKKGPQTKLDVNGDIAATNYRIDLLTELV